MPSEEPTADPAALDETQVQKELTEGEAEARRAEARECRRS